MNHGPAAETVKEGARRLYAAILRPIEIYTASLFDPTFGAQHLHQTLSQFYIVLFLGDTLKYSYSRSLVSSG